MEGQCLEQNEDGGEQNPDPRRLARVPDPDSDQRKHAGADHMAEGDGVQLLFPQRPVQILCCQHFLFFVFHGQSSSTYWSACADRSLSGTPPAHKPESLLRPAGTGNATGLSFKPQDGSAPAASSAYSKSMGYICFPSPSAKGSFPFKLDQTRPVFYSDCNLHMLSIENLIQKNSPFPADILGVLPK